VLEQADTTLMTNLTDFTPSAGKKYRLALELDTDFGSASFGADLTRVRDVPVEDFSMSYIDPKQIVNVLRAPLADLHNIDIFKRGGVVLEFKPDGVYLRKQGDPANSVFLRAQNLREYAYKLIRKIAAAGEALVLDFNFLNVYVQILRKLRIGELSLYMDNKIKHSNGVKLHLIADCENLLLTFARKCNYDANLEAEYIAVRNAEHSAYKTEKQEAVSQLSGRSEYLQSKGEEHSQVGTHKSQKINYCTPPDSSALYMAREDVRDFKLHASNVKANVEKHEQSAQHDNAKVNLGEGSNRKAFGFFNSLKEKSMSNAFEGEDRRGKYDERYGLKHLRVNRK